MAEQDAATAGQGPSPAANPPPAAVTGQPRAETGPGGAPEGFDADFPETKVESSFDQDFPAKPPGILPDSLQVPMSVPEWKSYLRNTSAGRVIQAFGSAWTEPGMVEGLEDWLKTQGPKVGIGNAAEEHAAGFGQGVARPIANSLRAFNRGAMLPLEIGAAGLDVVNKTAQGAIAALAQIGKEAETPAEMPPGVKPLLPIDISPGHALAKLASPLAEVAEAEWDSMGQMLPHGPRLPVHVAERRAAGVIGEGEHGYFNTAEPTDAQMAARAAAQAEATPGPKPAAATVSDWVQDRLGVFRRISEGDPSYTVGSPEGVENVAPKPGQFFSSPEMIAEYRFLRENAADPDAVLRAYPGLTDFLLKREADSAAQAAYDPRAGHFSGAPSAPAEPPRPTIHDVARQIDPDLTAKRDALEARRSDYIRWLGELSETRNAEAEEHPDVKAADEKIADLERKRDNAGARTRGRWEKELEDAQAERDEALQRARSTDTRDMAQVRQDLIKTTHALWDLGPDLKLVYDEAQSRMPPEPEASAVPEEIPGAAEAAGTASEAGQRGAEPAPAASIPGEAAPGGQPQAVGAAASPPLPESVKHEPVEQQVARIRDDVDKRLRDIGQDAQVARAIAEIWAARFETRASHLGMSPGELWDKEKSRYEFRLGRPVPAAVKAAEFAQDNPEAFYSALERGVGAAKQARAKGSDWVGFIKNLAGVKDEELEWSGILDWLNDRKDETLTRDQVLAQVESRTPQLVEVMKGGDAAESAFHERIEQLRGQLHDLGYSIEVNPEDDSMVVFLAHDDPDGEFLSAEDIKHSDFGSPANNERASEIAREVERLHWERDENEGSAGARGPNGVRYPSYTLPGGKNYRELLLTLPADRVKSPSEAASLELAFEQRTGHAALDGEGHATAEFEASPEGRQWDVVFSNRHVERSNATFRSSHWDEPNILAHIRFNERTGPNGERLLHVEEIQSDWHQRGRDRGYRMPVTTPPLEEISRELGARVHEARGVVPDAPWALTWRDGSANYFPTREGAEAALVDDWHKAHPPKGEVPNAPFKKTWHELAFKRMLHYAADHGFDGITWTTGTQQAQRFSLDRQVKRLAWNPVEKTLDIDPFGGGQVVTERGITAENLADWVGQDVAERLKAQPQNEHGYHLLEGEGLRAGGGGMRGFYDKILRDYASRVGKKAGAKVSTTKFETDITREVPTFKPISDGDWDGLAGAESFPDGNRPLSSSTTIRVDGQTQPVHLIIDPEGVHFIGDNELEAFIPREEVSAVAWRNPAVALREISDGWKDPTSNFWASMRSILGEEHEVGPAVGTAQVHYLPMTEKLRDQMLGGQPLYSGKRGNVRLLEDGRRIITLMHDADASTFMHESSHIWLEDLLEDAKLPEAPEQLKRDAQTALDWMGVSRDEFERKTRTGRRTAKVTRGHEKWARGFERYLMEGVAPSRGLARVFAQFRQWLTAIYQSVSRLRSPINDDIRDVFDRLLAKAPERVTIAPDRPVASGLADLHEADAAATPGQDAEAAHDRAHDETAAHVDAEHPELRGSLQIDGQAGAGASQRAGDDSQVNGAQPLAGQAGGVPGARAVVPGAGGTARQSLGPPRPVGYGPPKQSGLYVKVPKRPPSLADWIKAKGGVADPQGEVRALGAKKPGLIKPTGMALDKLARDAHEAGFFPEWGPVGEGEEPTANDLLRKLDEDLHGNHQWSEDQRDEVAEYQAAVQRNDEVDRLAAELDINEKGLSYEAFWDKVAERLSEENRDKEVDAQLDADMQVAAEEARGQSHEYDAETGREGVSEEEAGASGPGTAGAGSQRPAGGAAGGAAGAGESGSSGQRAPGVEEGQGQGGGTAGPAGGNQTPRAARVRDDVLIDKAGNIRLDLLNAPDDVDAALRQIALENDDFEADRFGAAGKQLHDQIFAARVLVKRLGEDMAEKTRAAASPDADDAALLAYRESANRLTMAARQLATLTHQWGLAGQAFREMHGLPDSPKALTMSQLAERTKGMTFNQLRQEAQLQMELDSDAQRNRFLNQVRSSGWERARSMYIEYFVNNLISGPITHAAYTIGNQTMNLWRGLVEMPVAAAVSRARGRDAGGRVYLGETKALIYSYTKGAADGWHAAVKAFKTDQTQMLPGELESMTREERMAWEQRNAPGGAIPGVVGTAIRLPSRSVKSIHAFGRAIAYAQEISRRGIRSGLDAGLEGRALDEHIARYLERPPIEDQIAASKEATAGVQMQTAKYGTAFWHFKQAVDKNVALKTVAPFMQIGANLLHGGYIERTPLGYLDKGVRDDLMGRNGSVKQDTATAKMISGVALSGAMIGFTLNGIMTGGGPKDSRQRAVMMAQGWQPYSLHLNGRYIPYRKYLGPLGPLVGGVADMAEIGGNAKADGYLNAAWAAVGGLGEVIADESWMRGVSNLIGALRNYDNAIGERYLRDLAMDFVPFHVGLSQTARLVDDYSRRVTGWSSAFKASVPFASESLPPRYDVLGRPISSHLMVGPTKEDNDPVLKAMRDAQFYPASVPRTIRGVKLTDEQYDDFARLAGSYSRQMIEPYVRSEDWSSVPGHIQHDQLKHAFEQGRERARQVVMTKSQGTANDIWRQSLENKTARTRKLDEPPIE